MKKIALFSIATIALSIASLPAKANEIKPIDLAFKAYQGYFVDSGIPSNSTFVQAVRLGQIDAETLVKSAIDRQRLPQATINDRDYLDKVEAALFKIQRRR
jgi:hypothetical protein